MAIEFASPNVLVVDDESLFRWSVAEKLAERGYKVTEVPDAASAMREFSKGAHPSDVVLLDLSLPDSSDLSVLSTMQRLSPLTPVILMTAHGSPELFEAARRLGAFTSIDKPFEMDDLPALVERALAGRPS